MEVSRIMERFVPIVSVRRRGGDCVWFYSDCRRAFELKQCTNCTALNSNIFCQARNTANILYVAAKDQFSASCRQNLDDCAWLMPGVYAESCQMFLLIVLLVVHLVQTRFGRLSCQICGLKVSSHVTLLSSWRYNNYKRRRHHHITLHLLSETAFRRKWTLTPKTPPFFNQSS